jgi:hypothetical protein
MVETEQRLLQALVLFGFDAQACRNGGSPRQISSLIVHNQHEHA